jgi:hypothetical protein
VRPRSAPRLASAALAAALGALAPSPAAPEERASWGVQVFVGSPLNARSPLTIRQHGEPDLEVRARWRTRPFESPLYYGVGAHRRAGGREWYGELVHHKLYLANPPPEVEEFSVSHGYNLVILGHGREVARGVWARAGAGVVVAHPESTVRGRTLPQDGGPFGRGYHLAGPALSAGVEGRVPLGDRLRLLLGGRVTGAYAVVPVEGGRAHVPNVAFHATAGVDADLVR